jgi:1-deoxy-D-xylulose-5-phosphate synthase
MKGGINEELALSLYERGVKSKILRFAIPDYFIEHGSIEELRKLVGLNSKNILQIILEYEKIKIRHVDC